jgi:acetylornithine deacetylase
MTMVSPLPPSPDAIARAVAGRFPWGVAALQELIAIDSVAPHERACQEALAARLQAAGLPARLVPLDDGGLRATDGFVDSGLPLDDRPNVVVVLGHDRPGSRSLILNSHIDVVPWQEGAGGWQTPPLAGVVRDGKLFGRGAVDAKGQVMTAVMAALALSDLGYEPPGRLVVESVVSEEPDGNGTLGACRQGWLADAAIVLEPTENHIAYGHRGIIDVRLTVKGQAGHGAVASSDANAILAAGRLAQALNGALADWSSPTDAVYGPPSVNVARIAGGEDIFTIPESCTVECGVRYAPGTRDLIVHRIEERLAQASRGELPYARRGVSTHALESHAMPGARIAELAVSDLCDAAAISPDAPLAQDLLACLHQLAGSPLGIRRLVTFPGGCDARHFVNRYGVPAVIFGPGPLAAAHGVDEYLPLDQWVIAIRTLAAFIVRWCA